MSFNDVDDMFEEIEEEKLKDIVLEISMKHPEKCCEVCLDIFEGDFDKCLEICGEKCYKFLEKMSEEDEHFIEWTSG